MRNKAIKILKILKSYIPMPLPQNEALLDAWTADLLEVANFPNNPSFRIAVSTMVLHLDAAVYRVSQQQLIKQLRRSVANQSAYNVMQDLKQQEKAAKAASEQQTPEVNPEVV